MIPDREGGGVTQVLHCMVRCFAVFRVLLAIESKWLLMSLMISGVRGMIVVKIHGKDLNNRTMIGLSFFEFHFPSRADHRLMC